MSFKLPAPIRWSQLKHMLRSPAHCRAAIEQDAAKQTATLERGSAVHALVFGTQRVVAYTGKQRRGKDWELFKGDHPDALILTANEHAKAAAMAAAVLRDRRAREILYGDRERTIEWYRDGIPCRGTPDVVGTGFVTELKTCESASPERFPWCARKYAYHAQLSWYMDAAERVYGAPMRHAYIVSVESCAPFVVQSYEVGPRTLEEGARTWRLAWERFRACLESGDWPGYCDTTLPWEIPDDDGPELTFGDDGGEAATDEGDEP